MKCVICQEPAVGSLFCKRCGRSYDRDVDKGECTIAAAIRWAANRTRRFERKRSTKMSEVLSAFAEFRKARRMG